MFLAILGTLLASLVFIFSLIEAIKEAVAGRTYWKWAVVAAIHLPLVVVQASAFLLS